MVFVILFIMETMRCRKCNETKLIEEFCKKKDKRINFCKKCHNKRYHTKEPKIIEITELECLSCNITKSVEFFSKSKYSKYGVARVCLSCQSKKVMEKYHSDEEYMKLKKEQKRKSIKKHWSKRVDYCNNYFKERAKRDPVFRMKTRFRSNIYNSFKRRGYNKNSKTIKILGSEWEVVKEHFESLFQEGMTWENMGKWHIDHIIPLSTALTEDDVVKLCFYKNLQPLWGEDNWLKSDNIL